ncbi:MAG: hypothetical protein IAB75_03520 [Bacteroidetes bacterium]|uniref:Tetratricopeptide repeat protein n=1 Tax=Candidatus Cryptobacteroides avicola TaxID=2840757 RepID=A0A940DTQ9_9BACT|nr:hypothetical protein [Candidatus Cryptobacteroides avicola]
MKRYIIAAITILAFAAGMVSCTDRKVIRQLNDVGSYINEHPDSALSVLDSLSTTGMQGREANAKFALLYSMALDKSYIDVTDDSLINIAVDWYRRHGTADERLKSYYYQGRIYQNAGDNEAAMESFVRAETASGNEKNTAKGLLYNAMSVIYIQIFDFVNAESYNAKAKECYLHAGDADKYAGAMLFSSDLHYAQDEYSEAIACLDSVKTLLDSISTTRKNAYYIQSMRIKKDQGDRAGLSDELNRYLSSTGAENISWLDVADYYTYLGEYEMSESALQQYRELHTEYKDEPAYHIVAYTLNASLGDYRAALDDYINYSLLSDSLSLVIAEQDTGFIQERYEKELQMEKERNTREFVTLVSVFSVILLSGTAYILRLRLRQSRREKEALAAEVSRYKENYSRLKQERDELSETLSSNPPVDRQCKTVLNDRLELLNRFFAAAISGNDETDRIASHELDRLVEDRDQFLYTTRMTFAAAHPEFISYLESKGLTENEIEYCCLYAIGLKGKEIGQYIKRACHYNESSDIRAKLGLGKHDTNLSNYLRDLLANISVKFS